jgi:hypothetical protein
MFQPRQCRLVTAQPAARTPCPRQINTNIGHNSDP